MLLKEVRAHDHADVGERQEELVVLVDGHQGCRHVSVHHADVHDGSGIDVAVDNAARIEVRCQTNRAVIGRPARKRVPGSQLGTY